MRTPQKRAYAKRGTAGTFNGRRPPTCPIKLQKFWQDKEEHVKTVELKKKETVKPMRKATPTQERFREYMQNCLREKAGQTRRRFADAVSSWGNLAS